jgi:arylsulfatase A-like enzyme
MTIPWIISGPRVMHTQIATQVHTMDTAATAAFVLGLRQPPEWDGVPVYEAFGLPILAQSKACRK